MLHTSLAAAVTTLFAAQDVHFERLHRMLPGDADDSVHATLFDADGDGDLDLFVLSIGGRPGADRLYFNDGFGRFGNAPAWALPRDSTSVDAEAADVDADGDADLVLGDGIFLNRGDGSFIGAPASQIPIGWNGDAVAVGDVDGDGDLDVALGREGRNGLYVNDGSGGFVDVSASNLPAQFEATRAIALGDVDLDDDLDLILTNDHADPDRLLLNNGTGIFTDASSPFPQSDETAVDVALSDVDLDGDLDVVLARRWSNGLFLGDGAGTFVDVSATNMPSLGLFGRPDHLSVGDIDGDGDPDVSTNLSVLLNDGAGAFTDAFLTHRPALLVTCTAVGDVDGDGDLDQFTGRGRDFTIAGSSFGDASLWLNGGDGRYTDVARGDLPLDDAFSVNGRPRAAFGDLDGDGDEDLVIGALEGGRVLFNDGTGIFERGFGALRPKNGLLANIWDAVVADFETDGDLDVLFVGHSKGKVLFLNDGAGQFDGAGPSNFPFDPRPGLTAAAADVDLDGDLDVLVGFDGTDGLYLNSGAADFVDVSTTHLPAAAGTTHVLHPADVDADGDPDVLIGREGGPSALYLNDGSGRFVDATGQSLPSAPPHVTAIVSLDVDLDGDLDLLFGALTGALSLYVNDGSGTFSEATPPGLASVPFRTTGLDVGDLDDDGDLDVAVADELADRLLISNGAGDFEVIARDKFPVLRSPSADVALRDVDGDGDLDVFVAKRAHQNLVMRNLTRQLHSLRSPRIAKPLRLRLDGPIGGAYALYGRQVPSLGWTLLETGTLDGQGRSAYERTVPPDPALVGTTFEFRARIDGVGTNVERVVFTDL